MSETLGQTNWNWVGQSYQLTQDCRVPGLKLETSISPSANWISYWLPCYDNELTLEFNLASIYMSSAAAFDLHFNNSNAFCQKQNSGELKWDLRDVLQKFTRTDNIDDLELVYCKLSKNLIKLSHEIIADWLINELKKCLVMTNNKIVSFNRWILLKHQQFWPAILIRSWYRSKSSFTEFFCVSNENFPSSWMIMMMRIFHEILKLFSLKLLHRSEKHLQL